MRDPIVTFLGVLSVLMFIIVLGLNGCGLAQGGSSSVVMFYAPDGATCYVVYDSGKAVGGNCQK